MKAEESNCFSNPIFCQDLDCLAGNPKIQVSYYIPEKSPMHFSQEVPELSISFQITSGDGNSDNPLKSVIALTNLSKNHAFKGIVLVELKSHSEHAEFFLPGYMYGSNNGDSDFNDNLKKQFQRIRKGTISPPYSPFWMVRADQLSHPVALMYTNQVVYGMSFSPYMIKDKKIMTWNPPMDDGKFSHFNGFFADNSCHASIGMTIGCTNVPGNYIRPQEFENLESNSYIEIEAGETIDIPFMVYAYLGKAACSVGDAIRDVFQTFHQRPRISNNDKTVLSDITEAITRDAYNSELKTYGLVCKKPQNGQINFTNGGIEQYEIGTKTGHEYTTNFEGLISWTNGTVISVPLLMASYRLNQEDIRMQAIEVINDIVYHSINPKTKIPYCTKIDNKWTNAGWWKEWIESEGQLPAHSSYIVGQALFYILKAYDLERANKKIQQHTWFEFVKKILNELIHSQNKVGAFPRFWDENSGSGIDYNAFSGCWVAAAMAYCNKLEPNTNFHQSALKAFHYYTNDVVNFVCCKTPLDVADAPDSEGVLAYIRLARIVHELDPSSENLLLLKYGLDYEHSFKFCYNVPIKSYPLSQVNWSTSGGSITSVCNAVIHCMSNSIIDEMIYYYRQTYDDYYLERIRDTYFWGLQSYNRRDNEFFFGKKGWSTEYFCQAQRYVLDIRLADGSRSNIWFAYHPWATASILEGICGDAWEFSHLK